jgi:hypothetical protein
MMVGARYIRWDTFYRVPMEILMMIFVGFLLSPSYTWAQSLTASVDRNTVYQGEQVEYSVEIQGTVRAKNPQFPDFDGFRVLSGPNESSNFQLINGQMSSSIRYSWILIPLKVGSITIGPTTAQVGGQTTSSNPITMQILDRGTPTPQGGSGGSSGSRNIGGGSSGGGTGTAPDVMVKAEVSKSEVYANEPVNVVYKLYFRKNLTKYEVSKLPSTVGFWSEDLPVPEQNRLPDQTIQGYRYGVVVIRKVTLFPTNPGLLTVDPIEVSCDIQEERQMTSRRSRSIFDDFFNDPFFNPLQVTTQSAFSNPIQLKVKPLPMEGRPESFAGEVGQFTMNVNLEPKEVKANEAVTLRVNIRGQGNIKLINEPKLNAPPDVERYDPKISDHIDKNSGVVQGEKTFEYLLIPRVPGQQKIPPIEFSYFDPVKKQYNTLRSEPMELKVTQGSGILSSLSHSASREDVLWRGQDIRYIKLTSEGFRAKGTGFAGSNVFYAAMLAPILALGFGLLYQRQKDQLEQNIPRARRSRAYTKAMKAWKLADKSKQQSSEIFYGNLTKAFGGYLADILNLPEAQGGSMETMDALLENGISEDAVKEIRDIFDTSDFARFASGRDSAQDREQLLQRTKTMIQRLEKEIKT